MKNYKNGNWLNQKYNIEELSIRQVAKLCSCGKTTIWKWLRKLNIQIRSNSRGHHLAKVNHCNLSKRALQYIDGELMGDGCLRSKSKYSANFQYGSKYQEYIQYISDTLNSFGIKQSGKIYKQYYRKMNCYTYHYTSLKYKELLPIYNRWYPEPKKKKIIPRDLKLTSLVLRQEFIGDGCLMHPKKSRPYITLATCGFSVSDVEWLVKQLNKLDFKSTRRPSDNAIHISAYSTKDFLNYIGKCPISVYQYKWNY